METQCSRENCTVAETGKCLLSNDPQTCPERAGNNSDLIESHAEEIADEASTDADSTLAEPEALPKFVSSLSLGVENVHELMQEQYCRVVGVLGTPDAGKTASLVSLYLLLAHDKLENFSFLNSKTLMAFEEISQGARRWNDGQTPEQMTSHTQIADGRSAGFLHLRLKEHKTDNIFDFILPDLPGEWTTSLIDSNRTDRLSFLKAAEVLWIMLDGQKLMDEPKYAAHRACKLLDRAQQFFEGAKPPIKIVITRLDEGTPEKSVIEKLEKKASDCGFVASVIQIASFSDHDTIAPGAGLSELILSTIDSVADEKPAFWPDSVDGNQNRAILNFRNRGGADGQ
tara:strand:- start:1391 stop:2416 length:1026 start_codon:yes stop_codon:yes gene_type:complete